MGNNAVGNFLRLHAAVSKGDAYQRGPFYSPLLNSFNCYSLGAVIVAIFAVQPKKKES